MTSHPAYGAAPPRHRTLSGRLASSVDDLPQLLFCQLCLPAPADILDAASDCQANDPVLDEETEWDEQDKEAEVEVNIHEGRLAQSRKLRVAFECDLADQADGAGSLGTRKR